MHEVKIGRVLGCRGVTSNGTIIIDAQQEDGQTIQLSMIAPVAHALVPTLHKTVAKLADHLRTGPPQSASGMVQVSLYDCETIQMGHDLATKTAALIFDYGLPSQAGYKISEKQFWQLGQGLTNTMQILFGKSPPNRH